MKFMREKNSISEGENRLETTEKTLIVEIREKAEYVFSDDVFWGYTTVYYHPVVPFRDFVFPIDNNYPDIDDIQDLPGIHAYRSQYDLMAFFTFTAVP